MVLHEGPRSLCMGCCQSDIIPEGPRTLCGVRDAQGIAARVTAFESMVLGSLFSRVNRIGSRVSSEAQQDAEARGGD